LVPVRDPDSVEERLKLREGVFVQETVRVGAPVLVGVPVLVLLAERLCDGGVLVADLLCVPVELGSKVRDTLGLGGLGVGVEV